MKKLFAILLALAMIFAMSATVFAADEGKTDVAITDGRTYTAHMLMSVTTSLKNENDGCTTHNANCYNYAYTVNPAYLGYWKAVDETLTTEQAIIEYLGADDTDMRAVADKLYLAIKDAEGAPAGTAVTGTAKMDQGYWLFVDETVPGEKVKSPVIVNTVGQDALEIKPKVGLPSVTKKVLEVDDATGVTAWQDTATYDIGDDVTFQLTATMPTSLADWATYKMVFHDTLSTGLTLNEDSFEVTVGGQPVAANTFVYAAGENGEFTLTCANVKNIPGINKDSVIVVTYTATLNANAVIAGNGNPNTVRLKYSNDPYGNTTAKTEVETVTVYTYQVTVDKVDGENSPLAGAEFKLEKLVLNNEGEETYEELDAPAVTNGTHFVWAGLDAGTYRLTETKAPAGYNQVGPETIIITNDNVQRTVENLTGSVLPETGAQGTFMLITGGTLLVVLAAVFMITRKKMSIFED